MVVAYSYLMENLDEVMTWIIKTDTLSNALLFASSIGDSIKGQSNLNDHFDQIVRA